MLLRNQGPCDFEGVGCRNEFEAVGGLCSGPKINVWNYMQSRRKDIRIIYFMTDKDSLRVTCRSPLFPESNRMK